MTDKGKNGYYEGQNVFRKENMNNVEFIIKGKLKRNKKPKESSRHF